MQRQHGAGRDCKCREQWFLAEDQEEDPGRGWGT